MIKGGGKRMVGPGAPNVNFKGSIKRLVQYLKGYVWVFILIAFLAILGATSQVLGPLLSGRMINSVKQAYDIAKEVNPGMGLGGLAAIPRVSLVGNLTASFIEAILILAILYVTTAVINYLNAIITSITIQKINYNMRKDLTAKFSRLPLKFFDTYTRGEVLSRVTNDVESLNQALSQTLSDVVRAISIIVLISVSMFLVSWQLSLLIYLSIFVSLVSSLYLVKISRKYFRLQSRDIGVINSHVEENYSGHTIVSVFNHQQKGMEEYIRINNILRNNSFKSQFISGIMWPVQIFFSNISFILIALVGGYLAINGQFEVGYIQTFVSYSRQINQPIQTIGSVATVLQTAAASSERIFQLLDAEEQTEESFETRFNGVKGNVEFKNVNFSYVEGIPIVKNFTASIHSGQMVAIVGPTGAGKTTLVNLLMRFYDIDSGEITIDGHNINEVNREEVRRQFGMVLQDTWIFEGTVFENIAYGSPNATIEDVKSAAEQAQVSHFIEAQKGGYNFILHEDGENISQGQRQLITIARAILANRPMIILDEATSSVDTRTEQLIQDAMIRLTKDRTSFVIAHRLSTIKNADLIFVLKEGNIVEQGKHDELLAANSHYAELYNSQFEDNE